MPGGRTLAVNSGAASASLAMTPGLCYFMLGKDSGVRGERILTPDVNIGTDGGIFE